MKKEKQTHSIPRLEQWAVHTDQRDKYAAPELSAKYLSGVVYGHPDPSRHPDGKRIETSHLADAKGRIVITRSGSQYRLGRPHREYMAFIRKNGFKYDSKKPVRLI